MKRKIIKIDEEKCTGCGLCIPNCPEGALQIIDGKVRLISDLFCDGLGACLGHCPEGAILIEEREAEPYDEYKVMENVVKGGKNVIKAHLEHLKDHNEKEFLAQAIDFLKKNNMEIPLEEKKEEKREHTGCPGSKAIALKEIKEEKIPAFSGCPGARMLAIGGDKKEEHEKEVNLKSELQNWPIQLTLLSPHAPYLKDADLLIAADCVAFAYPNFHQKFLKGKILTLFCPKLDTTIEEYIDKLSYIFKNSDIKSITLLHMEVPCCFGTDHIVKRALNKAEKDIKLEKHVISLKGEVLN